MIGSDCTDSCKSNYHTIMTTTDWSMKHGNSSEYKCNTIRTTIRSRPRQTVVWSMVIIVNISVYCVTLVFTTITMLHISVCRGGDRMVVLIVLHLYSLLLPCFILQSVITTTTDWSMKHGNSSEYKCNTITSVRHGRDRMAVLIVLHLYSLLLPCFTLQSVVVVIAW
jgi:hypothetical protein